MSSINRDDPFDTILRGPRGLNSNMGRTSDWAASDLDMTPGGRLASHFSEGNFSRNMPTGRPNEEPRLLDQAAKALKWEYAEKQAAADRQFDRNSIENEAMRSFIGGGASRLRGLAGQTAGEFDSIINETIGYRDRAFGGVERMTNEMIGIVDAGADAYARNTRSLAQQGMADMRGAAGQAVSTAKNAASSYNTGVTENAIQATVGGIRQGFRNAKSMIEKGLNPDGTMMTQAERMEATRKLGYDTGLQIAQVVSATREEAQKTLAGLKMNLAQVELSAGAMEGEAAKLGMAGEEAGMNAAQAKAGVRGQASQTLLATADGQRQFQQLLGSFKEMKTTLMNGMETASLQFEMQGRQYLADAVRNNPETVMGIFSGLMALATMATAPGGRAAAPLRF